MIFHFAFFVAGSLTLWAVLAPCMVAVAQSVPRREPLNRIASPPEKVAVAIPQSTPSAATIHWQGVSLRDAVARLQPLFNDTVFLDRRVDPNVRVNLDITASSAQQVLSGLADVQPWSVARLDRLVYLAPNTSAAELNQLVAQRSRDVARLPPKLRAEFANRQPLQWTRLSEPRQVVTSLITRLGWQVADAQQIPFDLWPAGQLPELTAAEALSVLLFGFNLTFEPRPADRTVRIVPFQLPSPATDPVVRTRPPYNPVTRVPLRTPQTAKHLYTLRVQRKPLRTVLRELADRLQWSIQIDEQAIRAAGISLDELVSFSVENASQDELLTALLKPVGLDYHVEGDRVRIVRERYPKN